MKNIWTNLTEKQLKERILLTDPTTAFRDNITKKQLQKIYKNL